MNFEPIAENIIDRFIELVTALNDISTPILNVIPKTN